MCEIENIFSGEREVRRGVTQGSVLSQFYLLFI